MLICNTNVSVVFTSSSGSISVVFPMFFWEVCIRFSTASNCHPSSLCCIHPLARVPWMRNMKHWLLFYFKSNKKCLCSIQCRCKAWILCLLSSGHSVGGNCLYLCGNTFGNDIQLEHEPSIRKAAELKHKIHNIWYKPIVIEETWSQFHQ